MVPPTGSIVREKSTLYVSKTYPAPIARPATITATARAHDRNDRAGLRRICLAMFGALLFPSLFNPRIPLYPSFFTTTMSSTNATKGKRKQIVKPAPLKKTLSSSKNVSTTAPDHTHDALGRTRGAEKVLEATATGTSAGGTEIPFAGASRDPAPSTAQDAMIVPAPSPFRVKIHRATSATLSNATSGGDALPALQAVSDSVESGFDEGLINFGTVNSPDSSRVVSAEELAIRFQFLQDFNRRNAAREQEAANKERVELASATPSLTSLANPGPSAVEEGSNTPTDGQSVANKPVAGMLGSDSISQALLYNREPGRIFISFG
ncbi:hypothetical protein B0H16DRAFT_1721006 [Mycena metata]|uniref:Uncharacterized protein n=1 Tax=Mycena metata TaxID=1033252 RepID=A0AAD7J7I7_9AGAR|nr:hypothetical protein B0H16DRAFT_1721006 [Mycena metata]